MPLSKCPFVKTCQSPGGVCRPTCGGSIKRFTRLVKAILPGYLGDRGLAIKSPRNPAAVLGAPIPSYSDCAVWRCAVGRELCAKFLQGVRVPRNVTESIRPRLGLCVRGATQRNAIHAHGARRAAGPSAPF